MSFCSTMVGRQIQRVDEREVYVGHIFALHLLFLWFSLDVWMLLGGAYSLAWWAPRSSIAPLAPSTECPR
jgi:hypothetical protein